LLTRISIFVHKRLIERGKVDNLTRDVKNKVRLWIPVGKLFKDVLLINLQGNTGKTGLTSWHVTSFLMRDMRR